MCRGEGGVWRGRRNGSNVVVATARAHDRPDPTYQRPRRPRNVQLVGASTLRTNLGARGRGRAPRMSGRGLLPSEPTRVRRIPRQSTKEAIRRHPRNRLDHSPHAVLSLGQHPFDQTPHRLKYPAPRLDHRHRSPAVARTATGLHPLNLDGTPCQASSSETAADGWSSPKLDGLWRKTASYARCGSASRWSLVSDNRGGGIEEAGRGLVRRVPARGARKGGVVSRESFAEVYHGRGVVAGFTTAWYRL